jgi:hypothetical protein
MKIILRIIFGILLLASISCKSSKKFIDNDITKTKTEVTDGIRATGTNLQVDNFNTNTHITEYTKYEPIYFKKNGKDTVVLKKITYKRELKSEIGNKTESRDTTLIIEKTNISDTLIDNSVIKKEFEGFNILQSILGAIVSVLTGPFKFAIWIVAILLIIPIYRFIKNIINKRKIK